MSENQENKENKDQLEPLKMSEISNNPRVLTCVYCGYEYPQDTPAWGDKVLTDHIKICPKHPMRKLQELNHRFRKILVDIINTDGKEQLEELEAVLRVMPAIEKDKINMINAIHLLIETLPEECTNSKDTKGEQ